MTVEDIESFDGITAAGSIFESSSTSAAYFSGYIANKESQYHMKQLKLELPNCSVCCDIYILSPQDFMLHIFLSFKEYKDNLNES